MHTERKSEIKKELKLSLKFVILEPIQPRESWGQRSLMGCCPWGHTESDMTEVTWHACMHWRRKWPPTPVFLPGESRDGGAWWAAISGVVQSRT